MTHQLSLFEGKTERTSPTAPFFDGIEGRAVGRAALLSQLACRRALTHEALDAVMSVPNLNRAYRQVAANRGSSGIDEMSVEELKAWLGDHAMSWREEVLSERYRPDAVRSVKIAKPGGGERELGIPTVRDRMLQQAIAQVLVPLYDPTFSPYSYGFRPNRGAHDALRQAIAYISEGREWVVDIDLAKFFDTLPQDRLMQRLSKGIADKRLLRLIHSYLRCDIMRGGLSQARSSGAPQGGPLSPLLSNIVLDELDRELERRGLRFVRYADDFQIYVGSRRAAERVMATLVAFIEQRLRLKVNRKKSGVRHCRAADFLGYTLMGGERIRISDKSRKRMKARVRELTKRNRGISFTRLVQQLNAYTRGWTNYFSLANYWNVWREWNGWIRMRLRRYLLKQCGRRYTIFKFLRRLGAEKNEAWHAIMYSQGWCALSYKRVCKRTMNEAYFARRGVYNMG